MSPRQSLTATIERIEGAWSRTPGSVRAAAAFVDMSLPISVIDLIDRLDALPSTRDWSVGVTFGSTFALGGQVGLTMQSNGSWRYHGALHDSGLDPYAFRVTGILKAPDDSVLMAFVHAGKVGGTIGGGSTHHTWDEPGLDIPRKEFARDHWPALSGAKLSVTASAQDVGLGGSTVSVLTDLASFVVGDVLLGPAVAVTLLLGAVVGETLDIGAGPGELLGLLVAGGAMFLVANGIFLPVIPLGLATWAATDAILRHGPITDTEYQFANEVFLGTLPPRDKLIKTNLTGINGRAFTWPSPDGSILLNLGSNAAFDDPTIFPSHPRERGGAMFIHELTHAWQMWHSSFLPMTMCNGITGGVITEKIDGHSAYYNPGVPGLDWDDYGMEQQAMIVQMWFAGQTFYGEVIDDNKPHPQMNENNPWFRYIQQNIRVAPPP